MKQKQLDPNKIIASLSYQISNQAIQLAERDALIETIGAKNKELQAELDSIRKEQIKEMGAE